MKQVPIRFLEARDAPIVLGKRKKTTEEFKKEVYELTRDEYSVLGEYVSSNEKIKIKHNVCSHEYEVRSGEFLRGNRCPKCSESKGERKVAECLARLVTSYTRQYKLNGCRNKRILPFDFAIFDEEKSLKCLVEYDGEQHFKPIKHFGGGSRLMTTKKRDAIKTQYCADNGIPLIRIPYWEFDNIDEMLTKELRKLSVISRKNTGEGSVNNTYAKVA